MDGQELVGRPAWERARAGLFLALQHPVEVPGVGLHSLLAAAAAGGSVGEVGPVPAATLQERMEEEAKAVGLDARLLRRPLNVDLSGGERKRTEMVQLGVIRPAICILDEVDSGLDVDALGEVARRLQHATTEWGVGLLAITHFSRFLEQLEADWCTSWSTAASLPRAMQRWRCSSSRPDTPGTRTNAEPRRPARGTPRWPPAATCATVLGTVLLHGERSSDRATGRIAPPRSVAASTRTKRVWPRSGARCAPGPRARARAWRNESGLRALSVANESGLRPGSPHRFAGRQVQGPAQRQAQVERDARRRWWRCAR